MELTVADWQKAVSTPNVTIGGFASWNGVDVPVASAAAAPGTRPASAYTALDTGFTI
jgi:hypothetical protein